MTPLLIVAGLLLTATVGAPPVPPAAAAPASPGPVRVAFERTRISGVVGDRFTLRATVRTTGSAPAGALIAHLNVASLTTGVYVDPEDWSSDRTQQLPAVTPASPVTTTWEVQAVNAGRFDIYLVLLPSDASGTDMPLIATPPLQVAVAGRTTITAAGTLPVVVMVPVLLTVAATAIRRRRRPGSTGSAGAA